MMNKNKQLSDLKSNIESMTKHHQIEVLRILRNIPNMCVNENKNGSFVNLTEADDNTIKLLEDYVAHVNKQETQLNVIETAKENIQNKFFKDNKDIGNIT